MSSDGSTSAASDTDSDSVATLRLEPSSSNMDTVIEKELQKINMAIEEINRLSTAFTLARTQFVEAYDSAKEKLRKAYKANKISIERARPFYRARDEAYTAKYELRRSAAKYRKACIEFEEARAHASSAEAELLQQKGTEDINVLANLNVANERVSGASRMRQDASEEQQRTMDKMSQADCRLATLAQQLTKYVLKASSYFDTRDKLQRKLDGQYSTLQDIFQQLQDAKREHKEMFSQFSSISVEFEQRKCVQDLHDYSVQTVEMDFSKFQEVEDLESLGYTLDENKLRTQSFDLSSAQSSASDMSRDPDQVKGQLDGSARINVTGEYSDIGVSFQIDL